MITINSGAVFLNFCTTLYIWRRGKFSVALQHKGSSWPTFQSYVSFINKIIHNFCKVFIYWRYVYAYLPLKVGYISHTFVSECARAKGVIVFLRIFIWKLWEQEDNGKIPRVYSVSGCWGKVLKCFILFCGILQLFEQYVIIWVGILIFQSSRRTIFDFYRHRHVAQHALRRWHN